MNEAVNLEELTDENGFLRDPGDWDRDLAGRMAARLGVDSLGEDHWRILEHIRQHRLQRGTLPWMAHVCRELELDEDCFLRLFGGPIEAWKIAGLPDPGEEARVYMENEEP
jgi:tRNA 2-thiouridine synthesizing protein E